MDSLDIFLIEVVTKPWPNSPTTSWSANVRMKGSFNSIKIEVTPQEAQRLIAEHGLVPDRELNPDNISDGRCWVKSEQEGGEAE